MTDQREDFEEAAARMGYNLTMAEHETGEYHYPVTQDAWNMWQECCDKARENEGGEGVLAHRQPQHSVAHGRVDALEAAHELLQHYKDALISIECECDVCPDCELFPQDCSHTTCAKTCQCSECDHCRNAWVMSEISKALTSTPQPDKWIPCSERLPTEACEALLDLGGKVVNGAWIAESFWYSNAKVSPVAWMPRPAPFSGGGND